MTVNQALDWLEAHPRLVDLVCIYVLLPLLAVALRRLTLRFHFFAEIAEAGGLDAKKLVNAFRSRLKMPPLPTFFMGIVSVVVLLWTIAIVVGCGPQPGAQSPARETARAGVMLIAEAVKVADSMCAEIAQDRKDASLASSCADAYDVTRKSLLGAQSFVDGWDDVDRGNFVCSLAEAGQGLQRIVNAIAIAGAKIPPLIEDALAMSAGLLRACAGST